MQNARPRFGRCPKLQIANCRWPACGCVGADSLPRGSCALHPRRGVTLIELMITILIISILAALVLGVASVAGETAREAQSQHVVERLHTLLMEHYDSYKTRRVKLNSNVEQKIDDKFPNNPAARGQAFAEARLYALREMMLMEVPDHWSDVLLADVGSGNMPNSTPGLPLYLDTTGASNGRTALSSVYLRRYLALVGRTNTVTEKLNTAADLKENQGAECLYMIVTLACGDGEARSLFAESSIGDTDGDGAPEFLDGWKHPINFLRWAPGFDSQIQLNANNLQTTNSSATDYWPAAAAKDHDPFDLFRSDPLAFRLVPLIYSAGRDEAPGIFDNPDYVTWPPQAMLGSSVNAQSPYLTPQLLPYTKTSDGTHVAYPGTSLHLVDPNNFDETATDNIHNHLLGKR